MHDARFVVQKHTTSQGVHWDLMLEQDGVLITFRLADEPGRLPVSEIRATKIFDHPLRFLTYEGPVQKGTGKVRIVDRGTYQYGSGSEDFLNVELSGDVLRGDFTLTRLEGDEWRFSAHEADERGPSRNSNRL